MLRLKPGDDVEVFDGVRSCLVRLESLGGRLSGRVLNGLADGPDCGLDVTLAFGCVRPGPLEQILRHCTELGVRCFAPILSSRATRRPSERKERWVSIVASAAGQCGRSRVPEVRPPASLPSFLATTQKQATKLILSLGDDAAPLLEVIEAEHSAKVTVLVGPEGGFAQSEETLATDAGFCPVSLGSARLRAETAAIVAVGAVMLSRRQK